MVSFVTKNAEYGNLIVITINGVGGYNTTFPRDNSEVVELYKRLGVDQISKCPIKIGYLSILFYI